MNFSENSQTIEDLHNEIDSLRRRIVELESGKLSAPPASYADFIFENSGESILIIDPYTLKILDANPNAARRLGFRRSELCQMRLDEIEMPRPAEMKEIAWQSSTSGTFFYEGQYRHKSGTLIPVEVSSRMVSWEGLDVLLNFVRDIRWRKEAEDALRLINGSLEQQVQQRTAELAAEKEKLEAVLGSIVEGVAMMDATKKIVYVNPAFVLLTNYTTSEVQSVSFDSLFDCAAEVMQDQVATLALGKTWNGEVTGRRKDGFIYPAILTIVPLPDANGRINGYVTSHQDISRFKALDKAQYSFITNVSHQLRTPLTNIKLYMQLLEGSLRVSQKTSHYLRILGAETERLEHLVQDILEMVSLDGSEIMLDLQPLQLDPFIPQLVEAYQVRAEANQQSLTSHIQGPMPILSADATRLRQALAELLDNALAYTPKGGTISLEVSAPVSAERQWVSIVVQDNGPGIPEDEQPRIFERFFRGEVAGQGNIAGTGLGLCIAQQIVQAHHGYVRVQSASNGGSRFTVWLPADGV